MLISITSIDAIYGIDKRPFGYGYGTDVSMYKDKKFSLFDQLIYYPTIEDFQEFLGGELQNVALTNTSFFVVYVNGVREGESIRANGDTMWKALASAIYARFLAKSIAMPGINPDQSENVQSSLIPPEHEDDKD